MTLNSEYNILAWDGDAWDMSYDIANHHIDINDKTI